jgi:galactose oxidase
MGCNFRQTIYFKALFLLSFIYAASAYTITVDSQETNAEDGAANNALDNNPNTFWHSEWSLRTPGMPHWAIINLGESLPVSGLSYLPRQDGKPYGNIGDHVIDVSEDGNTWIEVAYGRFVDDQLVKRVLWATINASYIRITVTSDAGHINEVTSAAALDPIIAEATPATATQNVGQWGLTINFPIVPVAVTLLPTGSMLAWSSWMAKDFRWNPVGISQTSLWDPIARQVTGIQVSNTQHDMFCPGVSQGVDGTTIVTGGNSDFVTSIYNPPSASWTRGADMNIQRGYQSQTTLSDGRIFVIGGSYSIENSTQGNPHKVGEIYSQTDNTWTLLPGCDDTPMLTDDWNPSFRADNHAWLFAWSNNYVFQAGPSVAMNWFGTEDQGSVTSAGKRANDVDSMCGSAVMYDAVAGKILTVGGSTSYTSADTHSNVHIITLGAINSAPEVRKITNMHYARTFHNSIVLPNGQVFVAGGQSYGEIFTENNLTPIPELWDPVTEEFTQLPELSEARVYHSVGLLLLDGTVFVGGGGLGGRDYPDSINHLNGQIYHPPYLFNADGSDATRPRITSNQIQSAQVGTTFTVTTDSEIDSFALIRFSSNTHTVNTDQRRIPLAATASANSNDNSYDLSIPADPGVALPGYWMVFAINGAGVPSVGQPIHITL